MLDLEKQNNKRINDLQDEVRTMQDKVLGNINMRLIKMEQRMNGLDIRTEIFVPKRIK